MDLLVSMGYGGSVEDAGKVVGKSGDGGIDGIIKQDKLGLDAIYVQAKRWKDVVGSPEIMKVSGGLTKRHATRGVPITTSTFTKDALEFVEAMPQKIVLIDGKQLASLMIEHDVGVSPTRTYTLKRLDQGAGAASPKTTRRQRRPLKGKPPWVVLAAAAIAVRPLPSSLSAGRWRPWRLWRS